MITHSYIYHMANLLTAVFPGKLFKGPARDFYSLHYVVSDEEFFTCQLV